MSSLNTLPPPAAAACSALKAAGARGALRAWNARTAAT
jgi:hypothetical protein